MTDSRARMSEIGKDLSVDGRAVFGGGAFVSIMPQRYIDFDVKESA